MKKRVRYQLIHADAFEWLSKRKRHSVHAIVTDPPFGIVEYTSGELKKKRTGNGGIWRLPQAYDGHARNPMPRFTVLRKSDHTRIHDFHISLARKLYRALVPGGHVIISSQVLIEHFVARAFYESGFEIRGQIVRVVKTLRGGDRPKGAHSRYCDVSVSPRSCWEPWLIFRKPLEGRVRDNLTKWGTGALRRPATGAPFADLIYSSPARGMEKKVAPHPSLKPQSFMRQIVRAALPLGRGLLVDPFMGAGSTIAAAKALGLRSIGIEVDEEYYKLAQDSVPILAKINTDL